MLGLCVFSDGAVPAASGAGPAAVPGDRGGVEEDTPGQEEETEGQRGEGEGKETYKAHASEINGSAEGKRKETRVTKKRSVAGT